MMLWFPGTRFHLVVYFKIENFVLVDDVAHGGKIAGCWSFCCHPNDAIFDKWHFYGHLVTEVSIFFHKCHKYTLFYVIQWFGYNSWKKKQLLWRLFLEMVKNHIDLTHKNLTVGSTPLICIKRDKFWMHCFYP